MVAWPATQKTSPAHRRAHATAANPPIPAADARASPVAAAVPRGSGRGLPRRRRGAAAVVAGVAAAAAASKGRRGSIAL